MSWQPEQEGDCEVVLIAEQLRRRVPGGIGTYIRELVRALVANESAGALTLYASHAPHADDPLTKLGAGLTTSRLPAPLLTRLWSSGHHQLRGGGLVHAPSFLLPPTKLTSVMTVHDLAFREIPDAYGRHGLAWHERALRRAAGEVAHFVVPSREVADELIGADLDIAKDRVTVIAEGADHLQAVDDTGAQRLLAQIGVAGPFLLSVGTIEPRKNLVGLIEALALAESELGQTLDLVVCGPSGWIEQVPKRSGVHLVGNVSDGVLAALYRRCSLLAYVPLREGYGLPVVEAMFHGAVVVASAVPSAAEGAFIVDPNDRSSIADGIVRALTDEELRRSLRAAASTHVGALTWARCAAQHRSLWNSMVTR